MDFRDAGLPWQTPPMRGYDQQHCPVSRASEIIAERWTPIIVRNLLLGCRTFGQVLDGAPGLSRSLLSQRLRELERHGILEREPNPKGRGSLYTLTPAGEGLQQVCDALGTWGVHWLEVSPAEVEPGIVLWAVARSMKTDRLPEDRLVIRFDVRGYPKRFWLVVERPGVELCRTSPGFDEDLIVTVERGWLTEWHIGQRSLRVALERGEVLIDGPPRLVRAFLACGGESSFAEIESKRAPADATG